MAFRTKRIYFEHVLGQRGDLLFLSSLEVIQSSLLNVRSLFMAFLLSRIYTVLVLFLLLLTRTTHLLFPCVSDCNVFICRLFPSIRGVINMKALRTYHQHIFFIRSCGNLFIFSGFSYESNTPERHEHISLL